MSKIISCNQVDKNEICISFLCDEVNICNFKCNSHNLCEELPNAIINNKDKIQNFLSDFSIDNLIVDIDDKHNITSKRILVSFFIGLLI